MLSVPQDYLTFFFLFALVVFSFVDVEELHYGEGTRDKSIKGSCKHSGLAFI